MTHLDFTYLTLACRIRLCYDLSPVTMSVEKNVYEHFHSYANHLNAH